jgi:hypothetical protein
MVAQVRYSAAGRSRGRVAPCAVCTWHMETRSTGFLVEPQNQCRWFVCGLASKPLERFLIGLDLKIDGNGFHRFGLKTCCNGFRWLGLKTSSDDFLQFGLKTGGDDFSRFGLKTSGRFVG